MSGTVQFNVYPSSNRVPGVYFEVDASQANTGQIIQRTLIIGQKLSSGTATTAVPLLATGIGDANTSYGVGSMLSNMLAQYRLNDPFGEVWMLPLADESGSAAATFTVTITGPATAAGTLNLYVAGNNLSVGVNSGDTATTIASNIATAVGVMPSLPCTASPSSGVVTLTARNKGAAAGDIDVRMNYYGVVGAETTPAGVTVTIANGVTGSTDPNSTNINAALANISDQTMDFVVFPYTGTSQLGAIETFLSDSSGRWSWLSELFGGVFSAYRGSFSAQTTEGALNNNQHLSIIGVYDSPNPMFMWAAAYAGTCATSLRADPALPLQNVQIQGVLAPPLASRFTISERNTLYYTGIASFKCNDAGQVILERAVTTYQTNTAGAADDSYLDVETMYTLMFLIRDLRTDLQTKYARKKLVADGTRIPYGVNFVTSQTIKTEVIANYTKNAALGLCQSPDVFAKNIQCVNAGNGQVSILWPGDLANQLRTIAVLAQFTKT